MMTRIEAWKFLREQFADYASGKELSRYAINGLCYGAAEMCFAELITKEVYLQMREDIRANKPKSAVHCWFPVNRAGAQQRVEWIDNLLSKEVK